MSKRRVAFALACAWAGMSAWACLGPRPLPIRGPGPAYEPPWAPSWLADAAAPGAEAPRDDDSKAPSGFGPASSTDARIDATSRPQTREQP